MIEFRKKSELVGADMIQIVYNSSDFSGILESRFISPDHFVFWENILDYYNNEDYEMGIVLFLPQFELLLRRFYGELNEISITAELGKYYVILDTIFYEYQVDETFSPLQIGKTNQREIRETGKINKIFQKFPVDLMNLFYDIFQAPEGIRLRDKVCHGEMNLTTSLSQEIFKKILQLTLMTVRIFEMKSDQENFLDYESKFHPNSKFKETFNSSLEILKQFPENLLVPEELQLNWNQCDPGFQEFNSLPFQKYQGKIKIFYRLESELEIVRLMTQIAENLKLSIRNYQTTLDERFQQYKSRQLRSSRRKTLVKSLEKLPDTFEGLKLILKILSAIFTNLQLENFIKDREGLLKFLKFLLKYVENMIQFSVNHNWLAANESTIECLKFCANQKKLFKL